MEAMECIVLAGGLGTRLRGVIGEQPKCMAPVNGRPFLYYLLQYLEKQGCTRLILSLGYRHEAVTAWLEGQELPFAIDWVIEQEPLGTGGGIRLALQAALGETVFILNGDTFFDVSLPQMQAAHHRQPNEVSIALKEMRNFERYGTVTTAAGYITAFEEKRPREHGLINGGIYLANRSAFLNRSFPEKFSFEKDYLEAFTAERLFTGYESDGYFIDIGVPEDYDKAQSDFSSLFKL